jgi:hypothetical protein
MLITLIQGGGERHSSRIFNLDFKLGSGGPWSGAARKIGVC